MLARDLMERIPTVRRDTTCAAAARTMAEYRMYGLIIVEEGAQTGVVEASDLMRAILPGYVVDDPTLARVLDEEAADRFATNVARTTVGDLIEHNRVDVRETATVAPGDTLLEVVVAMVSSGVQIIEVADSDGRHLGAILLSRLLATVAQLAGQDSPGVQARLANDLLAPEATEPVDEEPA